MTTQLHLKNHSLLFKNQNKKSFPFIGNKHYSWLLNGIACIAWDEMIYKSDLFKQEKYESHIWFSKKLG